MRTFTKAKITVLLLLAITQTSHCMFRSCSKKQKKGKYVEIKETEISHTDYGSRLPQKNAPEHKIPVPETPIVETHKRKCPKLKNVCEDAANCCKKIAHCPNSCCSWIIDDCKPCGERSSEICCYATCGATATCILGFFLTLIIGAVIQQN